jgi:uncharacterized protein DUF3768
MPCSASKIAALNDAFRKTLAGGKVVLTRGISELGSTAVGDLLLEVRSFHQFTEENDPHEEHDFGSIQYDGHKVFWKIDLYEEPGVKAGNGEPVVTRVLTVMLAGEY